MSEAAKIVGGIVVGVSIPALLILGLMKDKIELAAIGIISAFIVGSTGVILGNKCDADSNQTYATVVNTISLVLIALALIYAMVTIPESRIVVFLSVMSSLLVASTSVIKSNNCDGKANQDYAKVIMSLAGIITFIILGYMGFMKKN
jgi:hypothetical protein